MLVKILLMRQDLSIIKKKDKGIYGTASKEELKDLRDEGIETELIPWLEEKKN